MPWTETDRNKRSLGPGANFPNLLPLSIIASAPLPIAVFDQTPRLVYANQAFAELNARSDPHHDLKIELFKGLNQPLRESHQYTRVVSNVEISINSGLGRTSHYLATIFPVSEDPRLVCAFLADVTNESELNRQLQKTIQVRDEFLGIAAHELRSPLTAIKLQNQLLLRLARSPGSLERVPRDQILKALEISSSQIQHLTRLTEEFLDVTNITEGQMSVHRTPVDLVDVIVKTLDDFRPRLEAEGIAAKFTHCDSVVGNWDRFRIEQVFTNLLTNAMKYGKKSPIQIKVSQNATQAILEVKDGGIGIDPQDHQRIFERFTRAVDHKRIGGWGLGLYIARRIVLAHSGSISVESQLGHGATFKVALPLD